MSSLADRAEQLAAHLVAGATGAQVTAHDTAGRQGAFDFLLSWPDGHRGALEVTLVTEPESIEWQGLALADEWRWPTDGSWEFRPSQVSFPYRHTKETIMGLAVLCDRWQVGSPLELPSTVRESEPLVATFLAADVGRLRRTSAPQGITIYPATAAEFVESTHPDFARIVESWHKLGHIARHLEKIERAAGVTEHHLFLVVVSEALPMRFFTDDFDPPTATPGGFNSLDALWIWSGNWHRYLAYTGGGWSWMAFPEYKSTSALDLPEN
ncbi:hypothetical protein [Aestuariimicrobium sp. T2.26MG-19.2B]|uniref:hypothetical protein n=1 Tax=Aestuariimicrobium sp. T2.26MG-19.2B TaxID=3040679 RepID=UPI0024778537|nr:hypothetical protein [Aestuariimicrobium sp. T2.26MG-19.2B]CAI9400361.1 hypothetical protein AESSP_00373 [Aestuariimicrobium sp. T2.26MG-19.2B]